MEMNAAMGCRLMLVDDDQPFGNTLVRALARRGVEVLWARSSGEARTLLADGEGLCLDYAVVDDRLCDGFGLDLLPLVHSLRPCPLTALVSAEPSMDRCIAALRAGSVVLPRPTTLSQLLELLDVLASRSISIGSAAGNPQRERTFGTFVVQADGLQTGAGFVALQRASLAVFVFLLGRSAVFLSAANIAKDLYGRRDSAAQALARRHIANLRRSLGPYAWLIESVPKRGYRISPRAFDS